MVLALGAEEGFKLVSIKEGENRVLAISCHRRLPVPRIVKVPEGVTVDDKAQEVKVVDGVMKTLVLVADKPMVGKSRAAQVVGNFAAKLVSVRPAKLRKYSRKGYVAHRYGESYILPPLRKQKKV